MRSCRCSVRTLASLALLLAPPAFAGSLAAPWTTISQVRMSTTMGIVTTLNMKQRLDKHLAENGEAQTDSAPITQAQTQDAAPALSIGRDAAITAQVRKAFIGDLARSSGQPVADRSGPPVRRRAYDVRAHGRAVWTESGRFRRRDDRLHDRHVDVGQPSRPACRRRNQVQAVRSQMRASFTSVAGQVGNPRQRQAMAEALMYQTCMAVAIREQAQAQSKPELLGTLASAISQNMAAGGIALATMALTDQGLVRR